MEVILRKEDSEYEEEMNYCLENMDQLVEALPTKDLTAEEVEEIEVVPQKENAGSLIWLKMAGSKAIPQNELEDLKEWNKKFIPGRLRAPLALSQRLNISG